MWLEFIAQFALYGGVWVFRNRLSLGRFRAGSRNLSWKYQSFQLGLIHFVTSRGLMVVFSRVALLSQRFLLQLSFSTYGHFSYIPLSHPHLVDSSSPSHGVSVYPSCVFTA